MAETVTMPKLGFDMAEGTLVRWVVQEGEAVQKGAILAEIETDKATVEVESNFEGVLARHLVEAGEIVPVNTPIAVIADPGEDPEKVAAAATSREDHAEEAPTAEELPEEKPEQPEEVIPADAKLPEGFRASPLARRMAEEMGVNLSAVKGSGPGGRIVKKDIQAYISAPASEKKAEPLKPIEPEKAPGPRPVETKSIPQVPVSPLPGGNPPGDQTIALNRLRAAIGRRMVEAKQQVPHFYVTHEYDLDSLMNLRKQINSLLPDEEKVSVNDFIVKATALALRQFPNLNAALDGNQIIQFGSINIGVAVAVEGGLLTVVCRNADFKLLRQIAAEVRMMASRARDGKVRPEEIEGSTFSISNLGMFDVENFAAIINPPEAAILAVGSARQIPIVRDNEFAVGWRMKATLSVDHRVSDGAEAARFMQALADYLEEPLRLLL